MIKKCTTYLLAFCAFFMLSCQDDEVPSPPKANFSVSDNVGLVDETEIVFTIPEVNADAATLYPYGTALASKGTVPLTFKDGEAVVTVKYAEVGDFAAVVVTNNHSSDGKTVRNTVSDPQTITITSNKNGLTKFTLNYVTYDEEGVRHTTSSTETVIDDVDNQITVEVPYSADIAHLIPVFETSRFAKVYIGDEEIKSGNEERKVSFAGGAVTFTVVSQNGAVSTDYVVTVLHTAAETTTDIKSVKGKLTKVAVKDRAVPAAVDNAAGTIVFYDEYGKDVNDLDSVRVGYELEGKFAKMVYGPDDEILVQDSLLEINTAPEPRRQVTVIAENGDDKVYTIYSSIAPKLELTLTGLVPQVQGVINGFTITFTALEETDPVVGTSGWLTLPANLELEGIMAGEESLSYNNEGGNEYSINEEDIDYTKPVNFYVTVTDNDINVTYTVVYVVSVNEI